MQEARSINMSLQHLGTCINSLSTSGGKDHIAYRANPLTALMQVRLFVCLFFVCSFVCLWSCCLFVFLCSVLTFCMVGFSWWRRQNADVCEYFAVHLQRIKTLNTLG